MRFQITEEMKKRIFVNSCSLIIPLLLFMFFNQFEQIKDFVNTILVICFPFVFGVAIAFLLYNPQNWLEKKLFENSKFSASKKRLLSTLLTFLIVLVILALLCATIIPSIIDSILTFAQNISDYTENFTHYAYTIANSLNISTQDIQLWTENLRIVETLTDTVTSTLPKLATYSYGFVRGIINFILAVVSGFYILLDREKLIRVIKKLNYSIFNLDTAKGLNFWIIDVKTVFEQFEDNIHDQNEVNKEDYFLSSGITFRENTFNAFRYIETKNNQTTTFNYISNLQIDSHNIEQIVAMGRKRWKIENEGFNEQKNGTFNISHLCSRHENGLKIHYLFIQIAHTIRQLLEYGFASVKEVKSLVTKKEISSLIINSLISSTITNLVNSDLNFQLRFDD